MQVSSLPAVRHYKVNTNEIEFLSPEECTRRLSVSKKPAVKAQSARITEPAMGIPPEYIAFTEVNDTLSRADNKCYLLINFATGQLKISGG